MRYKQAILVRADLKMGKGKAAAQVAHAAVIGSEIVRKGWVSWWMGWMKEGQGKVVLKVKDIAELMWFKSKAEELGLPVAVVEDKGLTQIPPGTITCIAIGPAPCKKVDELTGGLSLL
ncbi:MAG: peptidyl-tRNA hydrolase Pth2 [Candidatus Bathyarchaeia archaeon]